MRRIATELSTYNRATVFHSAYTEAPPVPNSALKALASNELGLLYIFCRLAGVTDVGYSMHGVGKIGHAFDKPSRKQVDFALKFMM